MARAGFSCWPACVILLLAITTTPGYADADGLPPGGPSAEADAIRWFYGGCVAVLTLALIVTTLWDKWRPKPPLNRQFAAAEHTHPNFVTLEHFHRVRANQHEERGRIENKVEHNVERSAAACEGHRRDIGLAIGNLDQRVQRRIDPLATRIASNTQAINQHLNDHLHGRA